MYCPVSPSQAVLSNTSFPKLLFIPYPASLFFLAFITTYTHFHASPLLLAVSLPRTETLWEQGSCLLYIRFKKYVVRNEHLVSIGETNGSLRPCLAKATTYWEGPAVGPLGTPSLPESPPLPLCSQYWVRLLLKLFFLYPTLPTDVPACSKEVCPFMTRYPWSKMFLAKKKEKSLLLKIIWKLLDKRTFQIPSSSNNQWIHASQPFTSRSMKYKMHVFNFPSSPPLNAFFSLFWVSPHRSRPCEPIKRTVHCHLPPPASQQSQLHHSILDYGEPFQTWVAGFAETAVGLRKHLEDGKMWGGLLHSSTPLLKATAVIFTCKTK